MGCHFTAGTEAVKKKRKKKEEDDERNHKEERHVNVTEAGNASNEWR